MELELRRPRVAEEAHDVRIGRESIDGMDLVQPSKVAATFVPQIRAYRERSLFRAYLLVPLFGGYYVVTVSNKASPFITVEFRVGLQRRVACCDISSFQQGVAVGAVSSRRGLHGGATEGRTRLPRTLAEGLARGFVHDTNLPA